MKRRQFLTAAGAGAATAALAKPAIAQSMPEVKWRLTSSFPKSLETLWGVSETFAKYCSEATDGKFQVQIFAAGEIVPGLQALDAVSAGNVDACHTATYYFFGKDPTWALFCAVPFGLNTRQYNAWYYDGDGLKLMTEFVKRANVHPLVGGNTGAQMGGWFRKEIKEVADLNGLKFRIAGLAGHTLQKLGVVPQQLAGAEVYPALEKGTIDAAEWVGPHDDEKLGFQRVAKYYYYPGWWEGSAALHFLVNSAKWNELPKAYQAIATAAAGYAGVEQTARYDKRNPEALRKLLERGAILRPFPQPVLEACFKAANELYAETTASNPDFKRIYDNMVAFRSEQYLWWQVAEYTYDSFLIRTRQRT